MDEQQLAPHVQEINQALNGTCSEEQIMKELKQYLSFGIVLKEAKRSIIRKYGGRTTEAAPKVVRKVSEIKSSDGNIELVAKVMTVDTKEVNVRGMPRSIRFGILGDETGHCPFTSWGDWEINNEDILRIQGAYTKEFRGELQINFGNNTSVEKVEGMTFDNLDVDNIPPLGAGGAREVKIEDLRPGMGTVTISGKVMDVIPKVIGKDGNERTIYGGKLADETGRISYTAWNDMGLNKGEVIKIEGAYVRDWKGLPQLNFDERCKLETMDPDAIGEISTGSDKPVSMGELQEAGTGAEDVLIEGIMLDIREPSGLIYRCPECRKAVRDNYCNTHGDVQGVADLRVKGTVDDGTGAVSLVLKRDPTVSVVGMDVSKAEQHAKELGDESVVVKLIEQRLLDKLVQIRGNIISDDFGLTLIGEEIEVVEPEREPLVEEHLAKYEEGA